MHRFTLLAVAAAAIAAVVVAAVDEDSRASRRPLYLGFYSDRNITSHSAGANLYVAKTAAAAVRARMAESGGMVSLLEIDHLFLRRNPLDPTNRKNLTLDPNWRAQWEGTVPVARELLSNGTLLGFFLGDELVDKCVRFDWIALMASTVKGEFPHAITWLNEGVPMLTRPKSCAAAPGGKYVVSRDVSWFSVDLYHPLAHIAPQPGWVEAQVQPLYQQYVYPLLNFSHQRAAFVPGSFSSTVNTECDAACYRKMVEIDATAYFRLAAAEPERVAAIVPWHWDGCETNPDCLVHLDEVGTVDLPTVAAVWRALMTNASGRAILRHARAGGDARTHILTRPSTLDSDI
jgi:hypothetical protein